jgi:hypothetical protein
MVDYNAALPQLAQFQAPNMLAMAEMANKMQLHQAQLAEVQRAANEQNQMRALFASGVDRGSPEALRQAYNISMAAGQALEKHQNDLKASALAQRKTEGELAAQPIALQTSKAEAATKTLAFHRETAPIVKDQATYDIWRANLLKDAPQLEAQVDKIYSPEGMQRLITTHDASMKEFAAQAAEQRLRDRPVNINPTEKMPGMRYDPTTNTMVEMGTGLPATTNVPPPVAGPAPAAAGAPFAPPANAPAAVMRQPTVAGTQPAAANTGYLTGLDRAEGRGKNENSTATGKYQFLDSTFVGTAKKVFPELADKSAKEILALRGTKLQDGSQIEDALEQRFRADNIASLASAGIQPTPGNTYLAHFLGAGGARSVLKADPNTPVSQLLSADAIAANDKVLAGKTAGEVAAWAANKFGNQPGLAASMTASNARLGGTPAGFVPAGGTPMSLGAPTVNNALMANMFGAPAPQNALAMQPQIPGALTPPAAQAPAVTPVPAGQSPWAAQQARAQQRAIEQKAAETAAVKTAELQVKAKDTLPKLEEATRTIQDTLNQMIGNTKLDDKGRVVEDKNAPLHPGFGQAVGFSGSKLFSKEPFAGTSRADFEALFKQVQGGAFLEAYDALRGAGGIALEEGRKATEAKNAMSLATSEAGFIKAANDYRAALTRGLDIMRKQAAGGAAPAAASAGGAAPAATTYTEGQTATGPNGAKIIFRNGQWTAQ